MSTVLQGKAPAFVGRSDVVVLGKTRFWAERGLIHCEKDNDKDGAYHTISIRDFLLRIKSLRDMLGNTVKEDDKEFLHDYMQSVEKFQTMIEKMVDLAKKAQEQGSPDDESAVKDLTRRQPLTLRIKEAPPID